jgi:hypothetical protein
MSRTAGVLAALLLASPLWAQPTPAAPHHGEPSCETISDSHLPGDFAAWAKAATMVQASAGADAPVITPGTPADVALRPAGEVRFVLAPEQKRGPDDAHAGLVKLRIPVAGTWRVAASGPVWIDLVGPEGAIASSNHGRMAPCTTLRKVVEFPLAAGDYLLQLSGNPGPRVRLLITAKP